MTALVSPRFTDVFDEPVPTFEELLKGIPSKLVIAYCSMINSELYNSHQNTDKQKNLFALISTGFSLAHASAIWYRIQQFKRNESDVVAVFTVRASIELIQYELTHYREIEDYPPDNDLRIFKAYLLASARATQNDHLAQIDLTAPDLGTYWQKKIWPVFITQMETANSTSTHFMMLCMIGFLKYANDHKTMKPFLENYLATRNCNSIFSFIIGMIEIVSKTMTRRTMPGPVQNFNFVTDFKNSVLLKSLAYIVPEKETEVIYPNFRRMKEFPLFEYFPGIFIAFNPDFLVKKMYNGMIFDFYYTSGIDSIKQYAKFDLFKSEYATGFSEKILFQYFFRQGFDRPHIKLQFAEGREEGEADCDIRDQKNVFLVEFKDTFFPDKIVENADYDEIKKDIDLKFSENQKGKPKGVTQLANSISRLIKNSSVSLLEGKRLKIFPVIIYTSPFYGMAGINDYLNDKFKAILKKEHRFTDNRKRKLENGFMINDLVMINLQTMFRFYIFFKNRSLKLHELLDRYYNLKDSRKKSFDKLGSGASYLKAHGSFEDIIDVIEDLPDFDFSNTRWIRNVLSDFGLT